ncbi:arsenosugar biosynthesis radical SAM (seleno)protein ArsS [Sphaerospermopsis sp. LEGE 08334]|uniref:arsenosugar biosynthesis radical SAM (seleno)protein ArsS n=1 Tax=Sphaerospermopsis sp. LEGE 08334 TaxID=1828651 RepID=UPI00187F7CD4|nr:arsenosugar biosynthesis radical SAM (seleno)protein ArsS [Sphaerospermopsis sp. LEGE 08334]MBE9058649.1 arsenosugar biosynthesis radical SAM protein ArsS [Sphaerospermopsis sp. LEGE 08334]
MVKIAVTPFHKQLSSALVKQKIQVLQVNLGKRCNLACSHCHVEAGPKRTEELSLATCLELIEFIYKFPEIKIVDLTGGAPEMNFGFKPLVEAARLAGKQVIVRSNLTIFFVEGFADIPEFLAKNQVRVVASLPCYLADNVDKMRGYGVFDQSIKALQWLNKLGYGQDANLILDLVYNPQLPKDENFSLTPDQKNLQLAYKNFLQEHFDIVFNSLFTITNIPVGRTKLYLERKHLYEKYLQFLESHFNPDTVDNLMCREEISVDYLGNVYDCDFNQMMNLPSRPQNGQPLTIRKLLEVGSLDVIKEVQTADYCYGCTAGCGSSCGGALVE